MATVNSNVYAAQQEAGIVFTQGVTDATLHCVVATYEASSTAANTVINLFKLPKNVVIQNIVVAFDALGSGTSLDIGDVGDVDRYVDGVTTTSAGSAAGVLPDGLGYVIGTDTTNDDTVLTAKVLGGSATGTIKVACYYSM